MSKSINKIISQIKNHSRKALGYEDTLSFNHGYISALLTNKIISKKQYYALKKVYASIENENCDFYIDENGKLKRHKD